MWPIFSDFKMCGTSSGHGAVAVDPCLALYPLVTPLSLKRKRKSEHWCSSWRYTQAKFTSKRVLWVVKLSPLEVGHSRGAGVLCHKAEEQGDEKQGAY